MDVVLVWQLQLWRLAGLWGIWDCSHCSVVVVSQFHGIPELSTWFCLDYKDGFMKAAPAILVRPFGLWQLCHNICRGWSYLIWEPSRYTDNTNGWHGQWKGRNCLFYCLRRAICFKIKTPHPKLLLKTKTPYPKFLGENAF